MAAPVVIMTTASTQAVGLVAQTRNPYSSVRLIQMKWNGTVSHCEKATIAARLASEKATHATSTQAKCPWKRGRCSGQRSPGGRCGQRMCHGHGHGGGQAWAGSRVSGPSRCELITLTTHRLDQVEAQLGPEPPDAHVHHVGARVEVVAP